ncbi:NAD(P)-dependent alcohol dehydrogenase [Microbacterium sp. zg.Y909]|uniref:NAD(P)-dependent alcohol dehydrogenase n=1 Tax=Microbacterium sp. zg.Y909 TaxID=2969413 RepID=UPI00214AAA2E|nr:NAD(P)-dependent alcohol dehydrogenase [Microbacterium sp. zg.Y909]MCR2825074.1 NAD(P)-dependent alcohol dehydrogenase [Microbacterium sp. zg.Y909]
MDRGRSDRGNRQRLKALKEKAENMSFTYPGSMRASVLTAPKQIEMREVDVPELEPNQVLVRVEAVGVCGSDTHFYETGKIGDIIVRGDVVLGHESAGTIVAVGRDVPPARVGARVAVEPQTVCRRCEYCKRGEYHLCRQVEFYGAWPIDGSFAEYEVIDDDFAHTIPHHMSFEHAAMAEPVSVAVHAVRKAGVTASSRVLITGAGPIGILIGQVARVFGASEIVVSDPIANRREFALGHGATSVLDPSSADFAAFDQHFDIYIDASGNAGAIIASIPTLRPGGRAVLVGMGGDHLEIPVAMIQHREITLTGTFRYVNTWPTAIELIASGAVSVDALITGRYGLRDVESALMMSKTDPAAIKSMVLPALVTGD